MVLNDAFTVASAVDEIHACVSVRTRDVHDEGKDKRLLSFLPLLVVLYEAQHRVV